MNCKITRTDVERLGNIIVVPYGSALYNRIAASTIAYSRNWGVYGWNYDVYLIYKYTIVTGYRPLTKWIKQGGLSTARSDEIDNVVEDIYNKHIGDITMKEAIYLALSGIFD